MVNKFGFTLVCKKKDLPEDRKGIKVKLNKMSVAIFCVTSNNVQTYFALPDKCPHKDIPLHGPLFSFFFFFLLLLFILFYYYYY